MRTFPRRLGVAIIVAAIVAFLSIKLNAFRDFQIAEIAVEVTAVAGLTVLTGLSGQISLGNGAFMAVGAYTTALLLLHLSWPFYLVLVIAGAVTAVAGAVVGIAAARLRGPYLAGATLLLGVALPSLALAYPGTFGGDQGLNVVFTTPAFLGVNFPLTRWQAWVSTAVALVVLVLLANLDRSRIGRNWRAVRDDDVAAALDGINVAAARIRAFVVSAACAGLAGALLAIVTGLVAPGAFTITLSIALLTAAVIGGLGSLRRRAVGQPGDRPRADLRHGRVHQPRPVQYGRVEHPDRRLRRGPHPRHARLPARNPGWAATADRRFLWSRPEIPHRAHRAYAPCHAFGRSGTGQPT